MKKSLIGSACFIFVFGLIGCNGKLEKDVDSSVEIETTQKAYSMVACDSREGDLLRKVGVEKDIDFSISKYFNELNREKINFVKIQDKVFENSKFKGKSDIHYPYFNGAEEKYEVLNSIILSSVFDACDYNSHDAEIDRKVNYEVKTVTDSYVSILFSGATNNHEASKVYNISFTINFDLLHNERVSISDVIGNEASTVESEDALLEKVHGAMKKQFESEVAGAFEDFTTEEIRTQLYQGDSGFFVCDGKIYIQFRLSGGSQYSDFIHFDMKY